MGPVNVATDWPESLVSVTVTEPLPAPPLFFSVTVTGQPWLVVQWPPGMSELTRTNLALPVPCAGVGVGAVVGCVVGVAVAAGWMLCGGAAADEFGELPAPPRIWPIV